MRRRPLPRPRRSARDASTLSSCPRSSSPGPLGSGIDVLGSEPVGEALADKDFLDYRLADVRIEAEPTLEAPDIVWERDAEKSIGYDGRRMTFRGDWASGPIQKVVVTMLALRLEERGLHPFHASAVRYRDKTVLFLGGESNHGKSMGQIEACRRGALLVSTETTVIDEDGARHRRLEATVPQEAERRHGTGRQGRPGARRREVLRRDADLGAVHPTRSRSTS